MATTKFILRIGLRACRCPCGVGLGPLRVGRTVIVPARSRDLRAELRESRRGREAAAPRAAQPLHVMSERLVRLAAAKTFRRVRVSS